MDEFDTLLHRTWVQLLADHGYREVAAIAIDTTISLATERGNPTGIIFNIPTSIYFAVKDSDEIKKVMEWTMATVSENNLYDRTGNTVTGLTFSYRVQFVDVEVGWQSVIRNLIANSQDPNQGIVTEKLFFKTWSTALSL